MDSLQEASICSATDGIVYGSRVGRFGEAHEISPCEIDSYTDLISTSQFRDVEAPGDGNVDVEDVVGSQLRDPIAVGALSDVDVDVPGSPFRDALVVEAPRNLDL